MDIRELSPIDELIYNYVSRKECEHTENDTVIDQEVIMENYGIFQIYEIRKCPKGHFYRTFKKIQSFNNTELSCHSTL